MYKCGAGAGDGSKHPPTPTTPHPYYPLPPPTPTTPLPPPTPCRIVMDLKRITVQIHSHNAYTGLEQFFNDLSSTSTPYLYQTCGPGAGDGFHKTIKITPNHPILTLEIQHFPTYLIDKKSDYLVSDLGNRV